jgi:hypothetical protein
VSGAHARLSASAAHRWMSCPASIKLGAGRNTASEAAARGTMAHEIGAACLNDPTISPSDWLGKRQNVDGFDVECDQEMIDAVQLYVDAVKDDLLIGDMMWVEMPLLEALQEIDPDFGGTADFVRYRPSTKVLRVTDAKFGGTFVNADDNPQLKVYAIGAMLQVGLPVDTVEVCIVQPGYEGAVPVRVWTFKAFDIMDFVADLKEAAAKTRLPEPPIAAGDWCKFCPARRDCPELERHQQNVVRAEFGNVVDYAQLASALASVPMLKERIKAIEEFAYAEAVAGRFGEAHGYKLVDKRPSRKWKSSGDVAEWAQGLGIDPYAPREVLSPAQLEAKLKATAPRGKKAEAAAVLEPFIEKVSSGTTLVPVSDERPPAKGITKDDFEVVA